jgi:hypothetical protein
VQALSPENPPVPILLVLGKWDDILTPQAAQLLMRQLCGTEPVSPDIPCGSNYPRNWFVLDGLVHNYEIFSPRALALAKTWAADVLEVPDIGQASATPAQMRIFAWFGTILGVYVFLFGSLALVKEKYPAILPSAGFEVIAPKRFAWVKLSLWLAALPLSAILMTAYMLIPLNSPTFNLIYGGFLGGYGLLMVVLYLIGKMPGTTGKLRHPRPAASVTKERWLFAFLLNLLLFGTVTLFYRSGLGLVPPEGERFTWVLIFTPLTALGFWIGAQEGATLARAYPQRGSMQVALLLIGLVPFFLYLALLGALGSISGMLGALMGLLLLALVLLQGEITRRLTGAAFIAAVLQSLLLYCALLPAGALFPPLF